MDKFNASLYMCALLVGLLAFGRLACADAVPHALPGLMTYHTYAFPLLQPLLDLHLGDGTGPDLLNPACLWCSTLLILHLYLAACLCWNRACLQHRLAVGYA